MPTKRFANLPDERRAAVLDAAALEFSAHGFDGASLNRIVEAAGSSKGAIYYWFEDKADLFATTIQAQLERFVLEAAVLTLPEQADDFWPAITALYHRGAVAYREDPVAIGLARSVIAAVSWGEAPGILDGYRMALSGWIEAWVARGQELGLIRTDVPHELLIGIGLSVLERTDLWLAEHGTDLDQPALDRLVDQLVDLLRRMARPEAP